jgi:probable F420-dependent oxidoreductase
MRVGVIYPHFEYSNEPAAIAEFAGLVETSGYAHIGADDHVIGPNPDRPGGWTGWVTHRTAFVEPFVLFSFLAGITRTVEFATCVLLLPQRQTVLVAKQAAGLDRLSGGRLRLGLGVGWSTVEYEALGEDFHTRGARMDEQLEVIRALWTNELVDFDGRWHRVPDAGINPLPVQRPIPLWFGGHSEAAIRRAARTGDGWLPLYGSAEAAGSALALLDECLAEAGRDRAGFGVEARIPYGTGDASQWRALFDGWRAAGATHASLVTTGHGLAEPRQHLAAVERFAPVAAEYGG